ncbi:MAG: MBL fold metallo-hydrolase [Gemmatimonadota bacterium]
MRVRRGQRGEVPVPMDGSGDRAGDRGDEPARLVVVGCGTVVPEGDRGGSSFYLEMDGARVLLDCGPGAVQSMVRHGVPWSGLTDLVLTHFHTDHVGAVPGLFFSLRHGIAPGERDAPLDVWGPPGTRRLFERLAVALGEYLTDPGFPLRVREIPPGQATELRSGIRLSTHKTSHTPESQAVRLDGTAAVGYTGDTGPCETLGAFLRAVRLLVCECSLADREVGENHLSPARVAGIAAEAVPERLLLTHIYPELRRAGDVAALVRDAGYEGEVLVAHDGLELSLPPRR